jgi:hypothetical protein
VLAPSRNHRLLSRSSVAVTTHCTLRLLFARHVCERTSRKSYIHVRLHLISLEKRRHWCCDLEGKCLEFVNRFGSKCEFYTFVGGVGVIRMCGFRQRVSCLCGTVVIMCYDEKGMYSVEHSVISNCLPWRNHMNNVQDAMCVFCVCKQ